ncbi:hypothetical protein PTSG_08845 [Salpingoeca rosetta]|uniref:MPN domain-containing protein n=1 Tax=Salpingoeca rosetta (strain ATCC 50818 / BSB-021) TaxID=946362 RepID=F2UKV7_SALR5|nr:uncharacterized protein PTSG_08845 [Salpingoeca rosetta]EGD77756.1 hypothetical protein PTSG_08845 [Salpingoeca rosetta]|eukprot:XP_004990232.1 hypothetical protein PTSG_08845 [Salpingoeca rosetta]
MASNLTVLDRVDRKPETGKTTVTVHPIVLLSVVDHYNRACRGTKNRAVGVLLGSWKENDTLDVSNSFAVPFEEDAKSPDVWFLDHDYLVNMYNMFRKVNAKERIVGWYHTGPKLRPSDIKIQELLTRYVAHPVMVIIDPNPTTLGLPTKAYYSVEEIHDDGTPSTRTFEHIASEMGAEEVEEVGVEHLLRDITNLGISGSLSHRLQHQLASVKGLYGHLKEIEEYLSLVAAGKLPINHAVLYHLQDIFNLLPDLDASALSAALTTATSDQLLVVYLASLLRSTIALHNLLDNKIENLDAEKKAAEKEEKEKEKKEKEEKAKADKAKEQAEKETHGGGDDSTKKQGDKKESSDA